MVSKRLIILGKWKDKGKEGGMKGLKDSIEEAGKREQWGVSGWDRVRHGGRPIAQERESRTAGGTGALLVLRTSQGGSSREAVLMGHRLPGELDEELILPLVPGDAGDLLDSSLPSSVSVDGLRGERLAQGAATSSLTPASCARTSTSRAPRVGREEHLEERRAAALEDEDEEQALRLDVVEVLPKSCPLLPKAGDGHKLERGHRAQLLVSEGSLGTVDVSLKSVMVFGGGDRVGRQERLGELVALRVEPGHQLDGGVLSLLHSSRICGFKMRSLMWVLPLGDGQRAEAKKEPPYLALRFEQFSFGDFCRFRSKSFFVSLVGGLSCQRCSLTVLRIFNSFWDGLYWTSSRFSFVL